MLVGGCFFVCTGLFFFGIGYFLGVYEVLDFVSKAGAVVGVMAILLVEVTVKVQIKVVWHRVWKWSGFQGI